MTEPVVRWITVKEVAERCGLSRNFVYRWMRENPDQAPPHTRFRGAVRVPADRFDEWLKGRTK